MGVDPAPRVRVAVLMGGPSGERGISLLSGRAILGALDPARYAALPVELARDGRWRIATAGAPDEPITTLESTALAEACGASLARAFPGGSGIDVALLALHGRFGEDGTLQGILDAAGIPYTGSGVLASALAMDKDRAKAVVARAGVRVPRGTTVERRRWETEPDAVLAELGRAPGFPAFVKPTGGGSSIGAGPASGSRELRGRISEAVLEGGASVLVEERLTGREVTCAVLGNRGSPLRTLPVVEIVPRGRPFFDYEAKYDAASCEEICPARISTEEASRVEDAAQAAHRALGCDGMSRSDFILVAGEPWYLETNTIPGMTENSLCPKAARAAGLDFPRLLDLLVGMALERAASARGAA